MKRATLFTGHLENISGKALELYPEVIREMIRGKHGVYVLLRRGRIYYIGLATNLRNRLKAHLRDRHRGAWDRFSVYLARKPEHIKEIESLLIRVMSPTGNKTGGKFKSSQNLFKELNNEIKQMDADRRAEVLGGPVARRRRTSKALRAKGDQALAGFASRSIVLRGTNKGRKFRAKLRRDGKIRYGRKLYPSPSSAATAAIGRSANGWYFWHFKDEKGKWVRLKSVKH